MYVRSWLSLRSLFTVQSSSLSMKNWSQRLIQRGIDASKMPIYKSPLMIYGNSGRTILVGWSTRWEMNEFNYRASLFSLQLDKWRCHSLVSQGCPSVDLCGLFPAKSDRWTNDSQVEWADIFLFGIVDRLRLQISSEWKAVFVRYYANTWSKTQTTANHQSDRCGSLRSSTTYVKQSHKDLRHDRVHSE